jgi:hypothetical protein
LKCPSLQVQRFGKVGKRRIKQQEGEDGDDAQALQDGVDEVVPAGARVGDGMHRDHGLQRAQDQVQDHQLADAHQDEFGAGEGFLDELPMPMKNTSGCTGFRKASPGRWQRGRKWSGSWIALIRCDDAGSSSPPWAGAGLD